MEILNRLRKKGLSLYQQDLQKIFCNPFYCGLIRHGLLEDGEIIVSRHEPLITIEMFKQVNKLQDKNPHGYTHLKLNEELPLRHHIRCENCDLPLIGYIVKAKQIYYYKCRTKGCKLNRSAKKLHTLYKQMLSEFQLDLGLLPQLKWG